MKPFGLYANEGRWPIQGMIYGTVGGASCTATLLVILFHIIGSTATNSTTMIELSGILTPNKLSCSVIKTDWTSDKDGIGILRSEELRNKRDRKSAEHPTQGNKK